MENQNKLTEEEKDEFVEELNLTQEQIKKDMEEMKSIEGFPIGDDDDILELSNPPYYTAYPNPYIKKFIEKYGKPYDPDTDDYKREPFVGDVSEGKNDSVYKSHYYHTKVPPDAIIPLIQHYTNKGDIILDAFCGSGMTGVAAQRCGRKAIIADLGVAPTFIAEGLVQKDIETFSNEANNLIYELKEKFSNYFETTVDNKKFNIVYSVWSEVVICPHCKNLHILYDLIVRDNKTQKTGICPNCNYQDDRSKFIRKKNEGQLEHKLVKIVYEDSPNKEKRPDNVDLKKIEKINNMSLDKWVPINLFNKGDKTQEFLNKGIIKVIDTFTKRIGLVISYIFDYARKIENKRVQNMMIFCITSGFLRLSKLARYMPEYGHRHVGALSGTFYLPFFFEEPNPIRYFEKKVKKTLKQLEVLNDKPIVSSQSATDLQNIESDSIDYIFVDPPFGDNIMYSELNYVLESWLKVFTNNQAEAIINKTQRKELDDYSYLMEKSFKEFFRIIKPNRWITVEFHNSKAKVWKTIQESMIKSGFIIAQVAVIDKQKGTVNQMSYGGTVKNDLMINAYKPSEEFRNVFLKKAGLNMEKEFMKMHLDKLPVEPNVERTQQMLYSKLLAQYIQNGFEVRMDASEFYGLLKNNFIERDGYWFNEEQIPEYEKRVNLKKSVGKFNLNQSILGIRDEKSAIIWLAQFLKKPKTYDEIYIEFTKNLMTSEDQIPELKTVLEENFVTEDGKYRLPSSNEKKEKEDVRSKRLLKEFNKLLEEAKATKKKIKEVRKESLLHGLMELYNKKDVDQIRMLANKLDSKIIESDDEIYAIIDWALTKED